MRKDYKELLKDLRPLEQVYYFYLITRCNESGVITFTADKPCDAPMLEILKEKGCIEYEKCDESVTVKCLK